MLFVMVLKWRSGLSKEQRDGVVMRRAQWNYPDGVKLIGEYWPTSDNFAVVSVFEAEDNSAMLEIALTWGDAFEIQVAPAITAEDGLRAGAALLGAQSS